MSAFFQKWRPAQVLLVDDSQGDVLLFREGFERSRFPVNLHHVDNGAECFAFLRKEGSHREAPTPDLVLLDLDLPGTPGQEVLKELVSDQRFCHLPVVIVATSPDEREVANAYCLRCSTFIVKPLEFDALQRIIEAIAEYWFGVVTLPGGTNARGANPI